MILNEKYQCPTYQNGNHLNTSNRIDSVHEIKKIGKSNQRNTKENISKNAHIETELENYKVGE